MRFYRASAAIQRSSAPDENVTIPLPKSLTGNASVGWSVTMEVAQIRGAVRDTGGLLWDFCGNSQARPYQRLKNASQRILRVTER